MSAKFLPAVLTSNSRLAVAAYRLRHVDDVEDLGAADAGDLHSTHGADAGGPPYDAGMRRVTHLACSVLER